MNHIMMDIETLSTAPNAMIISIGAVAFTANEIGDTFYMTIDTESYPEGVFDIDPQTVQWWNEQSDEAREVFNNEHTAHVHVVLAELYEFFSRYPGACVWGNGAGFDNVIVKQAYRLLGSNFGAPWPFYNDRCYRTVMGLAKSIHGYEPTQREGVHHNALDDAIYQAENLQYVIKRYY